MDILKEGLDPKNTAFVLDTYWIQYGGGDVRRWIEELSGRISVLHLKDMGIHGETPFYAEIGQGNLYGLTPVRNRFFSQDPVFFS